MSVSQDSYQFSKQNEKCILCFRLVRIETQWNKTCRHKTALCFSRTINFPKDSLLHFSPLSFLGKGRLTVLLVCMCVCLFLTTYKPSDKFSINFVRRVQHWKVHTHFYSLNPTINKAKWWPTSNSWLLHDKKQGTTNSPNRNIFSLFSEATYVRKHTFGTSNWAINLTTYLVRWTSTYEMFKPRKIQILFKKRIFRFLFYISPVLWSGGALPAKQEKPPLVATTWIHTWVTLVWCNIVS